MKKKSNIKDDYPDLLSLMTKNKRASKRAKNINYLNKKRKRG